MTWSCISVRKPSVRYYYYLARHQATKSCNLPIMQRRGNGTLL